MSSEQEMNFDCILDSALIDVCGIVQIGGHKGNASMDWLAVSEYNSKLILI